MWIKTRENHKVSESHIWFDFLGQKHSSALPASLRWTAPEILHCPKAAEGVNSPVTTACDVFSFAMVLWEVASAQDPFPDVELEEEVHFIAL